MYSLARGQGGHKLGRKMSVVLQGMWVESNSAWGSLSTGKPGPRPLHLENGYTDNNAHFKGGCERPRRRCIGSL